MVQATPTGDRFDSHKGHIHALNIPFVLGKLNDCRPPYYKKRLGGFPNLGPGVIAVFLNRSHGQGNCWLRWYYIII